MDTSGRDTETSIPLGHTELETPTRRPNGDVKHTGDEVSFRDTKLALTQVSEGDLKTWSLSHLGNRDTQRTRKPER